MKLSIKNRIGMQSILPSKGNFLTLTIKDDILKKVSILQKESKDIDLKIEGERIKWDVEKEKPLEVEFTEAEESMIIDVLKELDKKSELNDSSKEIYKIFITSN